MEEIKVYISGAITGTTDYIKRFEVAEKRLNDLGYTVYNPAKINSNLPQNTSYEDYMKVSMCLLSMCDVIYMLDGWEKSSGANREYGYAIGRNMKVLEDKEIWI